MKRPKRHWGGEKYKRKSRKMWWTEEIEGLIEKKLQGYS
jgi:hypothetical protein